MAVSRHVGDERDGAVARLAQREPCRREERGCVEPRRRPELDRRRIVMCE